LSSARNPPANPKAKDAVELMSLAPQRQRYDLSLLRDTLDAFISTESPAVFHELIKPEIVLLNDINEDTMNQTIAMLGKNARFATQEQVDQVATRACFEDKSLPQLKKH